MKTAQEAELMTLQIAEAVASAGGRAYYVGGCVRDGLMGRETKDIDVEIHRLEYRTLKEILESLGRLQITGASFGVFGLKGYELDIAMPRRERATGRGHKDFEIFVDPYIGEEKAAQRRDFTINSLLRDVLTGEVLDFYGGVADLESKTLRHVKDDTFAEDPLRVLRAAQFAARLGFTVAPETVRLCSSMDLTSLARERVMEELKKALLKSGKPSVFFEVLRAMNQLDFWFPELKQLIGLEQNPVFHPEGDVWQHTMRTLDRAAGLRNEAKEPVGFMLAALCHDFGKSCTTEKINGVIHAYRHETAGIPIVHSFIRRLTGENLILRYVENMTELHMRPNIMLEQNAAKKTYMKLFDTSLCPEDLLLLAKADCLGCGVTPEEYRERELLLRKKLREFRELMEKPYVQGADLIQAGIEPGPEIGRAMEYAHKLRLAGIEKADALNQTLGYMRGKRK